MTNVIRTCTSQEGRRSSENGRAWRLEKALPKRQTKLLHFCCVPQSISNQTHAQPLRSTPQRSEILSRMGRPHPPLQSVLGLGSEGFSKPGPGSHTLPRTEPSEITTVSEICSSGDSPAWRTLLVTSSLTTSRTASRLGVSLISICVTESRAGSVRVTTYPRYTSSPLPGSTFTKVNAV